MIATSYWSLLAPAIALAKGGPLPAWVPAVVGFVLGSGFLWGVDKVLPHLHPGLPAEEAEGLRTGWQRSVLLVLAITLHNIPEGLAVGVAFGALAAGLPAAGVVGAAAVLQLRNMLPYALAFAAGAMIYVVVEEVIPEAQRGHDTHLPPLVRCWDSC